MLFKVSCIGLVGWSANKHHRRQEAHVRVRGRSGAILGMQCMGTIV
eukprot:XP_001708229.1 Hypothetical protein GL50803_34736 [Giardia lamblia ATCC 50803]